MLCFCQVAKRICQVKKRLSPIVFLFLTCQSTTLESLRRFVAAVVEIFGAAYLTYPNKGHVDKPTIILDVVASNDLWI